MLENLGLWMKVQLSGYKLIGGRRWYQYIEFSPTVSTKQFVGPRGVVRTQTFAKFLENFSFTKDDKVLDIGSNAGLFSIICAQKCSHVIGIELDPGFIKHCEMLQELMKKKNYRLDNIRFINDSILNHLDLFADRTVILASKVLYHKGLENQTKKIMETIRNSKCRAILLQGHTTQGEIGQEEGMKKTYGRVWF